MPRSCGSNVVSATNDARELIPVHTRRSASPVDRVNPGSAAQHLPKRADGPRGIEKADQTPGNLARFRSRPRLDFCPLGIEQKTNGWNVAEHREVPQSDTEFPIAPEHRRLRLMIEVPQREVNPPRTFSCSLSTTLHATLQLGERFGKPGLIRVKPHSFRERVARFPVPAETGKRHRVAELGVGLT